MSRMSFERAYYQALKSVAKKDRKERRRNSPGLPGIAMRVPGSERKALMRKAAEVAEKKTNYKRDGEKHVMRGTPGNALVYLFSPRPTAEEWDDPDERGTYLRNNGIFIAQVDDVRGYFPEDPGERYRVSWWSGSFADIEDYFRRHKGAYGVYGRSSRAPTLTEMAEMNGNQLMDVALNVLGYGAGVEGETHIKSFKEALTVADRARLDF